MKYLFCYKSPCNEELQARFAAPPGVPFILFL